MTAKSFDGEEPHSELTRRQLLEGSSLALLAVVVLCQTTPLNPILFT